MLRLSATKICNKCTRYVGCREYLPPIKLHNCWSENIAEEAFVTSQIAGYKIAECCSNYGGVQQRWLVVKSEARTEADLKQLEKRLLKQQEKAQSELRQLSQQEFACAADAMKAARHFESQLRFHQLAEIEIIERSRHAKSGRPRKDAQPTHCCYLVRASLVPNEVMITTEHRRAGRLSRIYGD